MKACRWGQVITPQSKIASWPDRKGAQRGRRTGTPQPHRQRLRRRYWVFPTVLDNVDPSGEIARTEIFGPVLSLMHRDHRRRHRVGQQPPTATRPIFTNSGSAARQFRYAADAGNIGVNIGRRRWPTSPSPDGTRASSAICTASRITASSSTPRRRSSSSAGPRSGAAASRVCNDRMRSSRRGHRDKSVIASHESSVNPGS